MNGIVVGVETAEQLHSNMDMFDRVRDGSGQNETDSDKIAVITPDVVDEVEVEDERSKKVCVTFNSAELMMIDADIRAIEHIPDIVMDPRLWNK